MANPEETVEAKIARKRADKAKREQAQANVRDIAELACLELEEKFSETGTLGVDFAIVFDPDLGADGIIVVKLGSDLAFRRFVDATVSAEGLASVTDMHEFVAPAVVHPTQEAYATLVRARGGLANRACDALSSLHRIRGKKIEGKF